MRTILVPERLEDETEWIDLPANEAARLRVVQEAVGGYFAPHVLVATNPGLIMLVHEDGPAMGAPVNARASALAGSLHPNGPQMIAIYGTVIVAGLSGVDLTDIPDAAIGKFREFHLLPKVN
ncbi:DUF3846 domain-containing protein [Streptomyces smyrnaeus]|uniref:DUF3846 domain-containing protein n=1 Tax=Streptomyces smyrnaeus TaxID=1387713 RepID=UPI00367543D1